MDNVIMHLDPRVCEAIEAKGAIFLLLPPYSPDFNPIKMIFSVYKAYLKRHQLHTRPEDWLGLHYDALLAVTPTYARNQFRHCRVPGTEQLPSDELDKSPDLAMAVAVALLLDDDM
jgi:hypothetical protein